jgi:catechol 2,3-dioxygenase-like lactoylglutathione lyase family enzyme
MPLPPSMEIHMAKIIGPDFLALQVRDLDASRKFYTERLNLVPAGRSPPDAIVFDTKPIAFAIRKPLVDLTATSHLGWGVSLWLACDDIEGLHRDLAAAGVPIIAPLLDGPFGRFFSFRDPDGYGITAHQVVAR